MAVLDFVVAAGCVRERWRALVKATVVSVGTFNYRERGGGAERGRVETETETDRQTDRQTAQTDRLTDIECFVLSPVVFLIFAVF